MTFPNPVRFLPEGDSYLKIPLLVLMTSGASEGRTFGISKKGCVRMGEVFTKAQLSVTSHVRPEHLGISNIHV